MMRFGRGAVVFLVAALVAAPVRALDVVLDTQGFEGYALGDVVGQNAGPGAWVQDALMQGAYNPAVIADLGGTQGKALCFDNGPGGGPSPDRATAVRVDFPDLIAAGDIQAEVQFDFLRQGDGASNTFFWFPTAHNAFGGYQTDAFTNPPLRILPAGATGPAVPITPDQWMRLLLIYNLQRNTTTAYVNGTLVASEVPAPGTTVDFSGLSLSDYNNGGPGQRAYVDNLRIVARRASDIPEPGSLVLLGTGLLPVLAALWRALCWTRGQASRLGWEAARLASQAAGG